MADQVVEDLKKAKSSLKQEHKPVSQVTAAQKTTASINEFVKAALAEENRWVLNLEEQKSIVDTLKDIKRIFRDLYEQCRTPHHFEKDPAKFISMQQEINRLTSCIHLSLDQGYYLTEPRGFSPWRAIQFSGEKIVDIHKGVESTGTWSSLPHDFELRTEPGFEEVFFYLLEGETKVAIQRGNGIWFDNKRVDDAWIVKDLTFGTIPMGYHPIVAEPNVQVSYIWVYLCKKPEWEKI